MKYSLIIPVYNGEKTLDRCLESIPNRPDVQTIVVSDGSTDASEAIARRYGVQLLRQSHAGVAAARNRGLAAACGKYVCFADCDDWLAPDYFDRLDAQPDSDLLIFDLPPGLEKRLRNMDRHGKIDLLLRTDRITSACTKRVRRSFLEESGIRFPEGLQVGEDFCFGFALALAAAEITTAATCIYHADLSNENSLSRGYRPCLAEDMQRVFATAAQHGEFLDTLDALYIRRAMTCLAELCKADWPEKGTVRAVCRQFRRPIGPVRGISHRLLRLALAWEWDGLLFWAAYLWKGRKFWKRRKYCSWRRP